MKINNMLVETQNNTCVALGFFDGLHIGHQTVILDTIKKAHETNTIPTVFTFSKRPKNVIKNNLVKCITSKEQKEKLLCTMGIKLLYSIDFLKVMELSPIEFVEKILIDTLHAKYVFCGFNYRFGKNAAAGCSELNNICSNYGIKVHIIKPVIMDGITVSSSVIRDLISNGKIKTANKMLGRDFSIISPVIHGEKLGTKFFVPTANQTLDNNHIIPLYGVYKSYEIIDNIKHDSITYIGRKPSLPSYTVPICETYILNYNGNLYGKSVEVFFTDFIREEKKFDNLSELKKQISLDILNCY